MTLAVGVVGCGNISHTYARNARAYDSFRIVGCASRTRESAEAFAAEHGVRAATVDELLADPGVDAILNLTPAEAHAEITLRALAAGRHVYTEKPLAATTAEARTLLDAADERGLRIGCGPDIFLGRAYQAGRAVLDRGDIGEPLAVAAAMLVGGPEEWHPNPAILYGRGAGPLLDIGPYSLGALVTLLGPLRRVVGVASMRPGDRVIAKGPRAGERFRPETPTHVAATLELAGGATANLVTSFDAVGQYVCDFTIHGTHGTLALPDPNWYGGAVRVRHGEDAWAEVPYAQRGAEDARGPGLDDFARAIATGGPHRASAAVAYHVLDVAECILAAAETGRAVDVGSRCERPAPL